MYVAIRVQAIYNVSQPSQWRYIDSANNHPEVATRGQSAVKVIESQCNPSSQLPFTLEEIAHDKDDLEIRQQLSTCATSLQTAQQLSFARFNCFYSWSSARCPTANLILIKKEVKRGNQELTKGQTNLNLLHQQPSWSKLLGS